MQVGQDLHSPTAAQLVQLEQTAQSLVPVKFSVSLGIEMPQLLWGSVCQNLTNLTETSLNIVSEFPMLKLLLVTSYLCGLHSWDESGSIFITVFHVIPVGRVKIFTHLSLPTCSLPSLLKAEQNQFI